jgi:hypothetical protein
MGSCRETRSLLPPLLPSSCQRLSSSLQRHLTVPTPSDEPLTTSAAPFPTRQCPCGTPEPNTLVASRPEPLLSFPTFVQNTTTPAQLVVDSARFTEYLTLELNRLPPGSIWAIEVAASTPLMGPL